MSFDFWLLLVAGGSQFIMTLGGIWMALRPPNRKYHWLIVAAYVVIGLPGLGAVIWEGLRTSNDLSTGINKIQSGQQQGFSNIQKQIRSIPAPPKPPPQPEPPKQHPLVVTSRIEMVPLPNGDIGLRLHYINRGPVTGYAPSITATYVIGQLTDAEIDKNMAGLRRSAFGSLPRKQDQLDSGEDAWFPIAVVLKAEWDDVISHKKELYIFAILTSRDDGVPANAFWVNEWVSVQGGAEAFQVIHKTTYLHTPKNLK